MKPATDARAIVYRVEHPSCRLGPYQAVTTSGVSDTLAGLYDLLYLEKDMGPEEYVAWTQRCPSPYNDATLYARYSTLAGANAYRFGFASLKQARVWFLEVQWQALRSYGFVLAGYRVPTVLTPERRRTGEPARVPGVLVSYHQAVFYYDVAERVRTVTIPERWCGEPGALRARQGHAMLSKQFTLSQGVRNDVPQRAVSAAEVGAFDRFVAGTLRPW